ncbi:unnamed protein product [Rotaria magnacalcarata]|uniref:Uncharacterized protein n=1 Tax=Rotaria magnacalcarata TaxID=392030 RepID=A0A818YNW8_9BILA|nr:unnamed protein product [Rotaria magnacalcarata]CAF3757601.1 unnamed protein product [Rotaria magnacalcarata]
MDTSMYQYLRILDIDPFGYFIRLMNISCNKSLDLSNINIQQISTNIQAMDSSGKTSILNSYIFNKELRSLLHSGEVVTIYSRHHGLFKFDVAPHIFIAHDTAQWLTDSHIRTEISINRIIYHSCKICSLTTNDVPLLFIHRSTNSKQYLTKTINEPNQYTRFVFPYCLSTDKIANPHTSAISDKHEKKIEKNRCYTNRQLVQQFDSYPQRLTTAPRIIKSSKKI